MGSSRAAEVNAVVMSWGKGAAFCAPVPVVHQLWAVPEQGECDTPQGFGQGHFSCAGTSLTDVWEWGHLLATEGLGKHPASSTHRHSDPAEIQPWRRRLGEA